jgi:NADPH-dependent curcumin reductase CurA
MGGIQFEKTLVHCFDKLPKATLGLFKSTNISKMIGKEHLLITFGSSIRVGIM